MAFTPEEKQANAERLLAKKTFKDENANKRNPLGFDAFAKATSGEPAKSVIAQKVDAAKSSANVPIEKTIGGVLHESTDGKTFTPKVVEEEPQDLAEIESEFDTLMNLTPFQIRERQEEQFVDLGGDEKDFAASDSERKQQFKDRVEAENKFAAESEARIKELEDLGLAKIAAQGKSAIASAVSASQINPEGVSSSGAKAFPALFTASVDREISVATKNIQNERANRAQLESRRQDAITAGRADFAADLEEEIRKSELKEKGFVLNAEAKIKAAETAEKTEARAQINTWNNMPAATFATMDSEDLANTFEKAGMGRSAGYGYKQAQGEIAEAEEALRKSDSEENALNLKIKKENLANLQQSEADKAISNLNTLNAQLKAGEISQTAYDAIAQNLKLQPSPEDKNFGFQKVKVGDKEFLYSTDPSTGKANLVVGDSEGNPVAPAFAQVGNGKITQDYGDKSANVNDNTKLQSGQIGTPGVDIDGFTGDPIQSFVAGTVSQVANNGGYGNQVIVTDRDGNQHMYSHLRELPDFVSVGAEISEGQLVGFMGNTGSIFGIGPNGEAVPVAEGDTETGSHLDYRVKSRTAENGSFWANPHDFAGSIKADLSDAELLQAGKISTEIFGKRAGSKQENIDKVSNLMAEGNTADDVRDMLRMSEQSAEFKGSIRDGAESIAINLPSQKAETFFNSLDRMVEDGNIEGAKQQMKRAARASAGVDEAKVVAGSERTQEFLQEISSDLKAYEEAGGNTGIFKGTAQKVLEKAGKVGDPELAKIATKIAKAIQSYRRSMSGVAFSVPESIEYAAIFPNTTKTAELNTAKLDALDEILEGDVDFFYRNAMGGLAYDEIFKGEGAPEIRTELPKNEMIEINTMIDGLEAEGVSIEEIKSVLKSRGIAPSVFFK